MAENHTRALIVLDVQNVYTDASSELFCKQSEKSISQINRLIDHAEKHGDPIVLVRHIHARDGSDLGRMFDFAGPTSEFNFKEGSPEVDFDTRLKRPAGCHEIVKQRYSAFQGTSLAQYLKKKNVNHLVICGFMTNFCCDSTSRDAHDRDFFVTFVPDATGCPDLPTMSQSKIRTVVSSFLEGGIAVVQNTDDFLAAEG